MANTSLSQASKEFLEKMVADSMERYEPRDCQIGMMSECAAAIEDSGIIMAEAGTGTGKTFAYLVPIVISGKKAIISTRTINLQEQLAVKDLKFLSTLVDFEYSVAKGRGNYMCLRRLNAFRCDTEEEQLEYGNILRWVSETSTGDIEDFGPARLSLWDKLNSDADACKWKKCGHYGQCFYFAARRKWETSQIIVANHAIVCIDAMLPDDFKLFPASEILVFDEGHALDSTLTDQVGLTISNRVFEYVLNKFLKTGDKGVYKGLLSQSPHLFPAVESLRNEIELFWMLLRRAHRDQEIIHGVFELREPLMKITESALELTDNIRTTTIGLFEEDDELELRAAVMKLKDIANAISQFPEGLPDYVRWIEIEDRRTALRMSPLYPRDFILRNILPAHETVIITSATLSVAGDFSFNEYLLGLENARKVTFPSPFDMAKQASIDIRRGIDLRNEPESVNRLSDVIIEEAEKKDGGVLVLFTSREAMRKTWDITASALKAIGLNPMMQGENIKNRRMLDIMRGSDNAVIFGLDSFWEGVDIRGEALKCLIITKLPFEVPTAPITLSRTEDIEKKGGNPFYEYSLPRAVIKFRQGLGRLIRSKTDTGRIIICDERIETKRYGRKFLESIY
jgi:ATP-dependent DNA helicase DinG